MFNAFWYLLFPKNLCQPSRGASKTRAKGRRVSAALIRRCLSKQCALSAWSKTFRSKEGALCAYTYFLVDAIQFKPVLARLHLCANGSNDSLLTTAITLLPVAAGTPAPKRLVRRRTSKHCVLSVLKYFFLF